MGERVMIDVEVRDKNTNDFVEFYFKNDQAQDVFSFVRCMMNHAVGDVVINVRVDMEDRHDRG